MALQPCVPCGSRSPILPPMAGGGGRAHARSALLGMGGSAPSPDRFLALCRAGGWLSVPWGAPRAVGAAQSRRPSPWHCRGATSPAVQSLRMGALSCPRRARVPPGCSCKEPAESCNTRAEQLMAGTDLAKEEITGAALGFAIPPWPWWLQPLPGAQELAGTLTPHSWKLPRCNGSGSCSLLGSMGENLPSTQSVGGGGTGHGLAGTAG